MLSGAHQPYILPVIELEPDVNTATSSLDYERGHGTIASANAVELEHAIHVQSAVAVHLGAFTRAEIVRQIHIGGTSAVHAASLRACICTLVQMVLYTASIEHTHRGETYHNLMGLYKYTSLVAHCIICMLIAAHQVNERIWLFCVSQSYLFVIVLTNSYYLGWLVVTGMLLVYVVTLYYTSVYLRALTMHLNNEE